MKKIAIFVSGRGSNFQSIYSKILAGDIPAKVCLVISNNSNCGAINFSVRNGIETLIINDTLIPNINEQKDILLNGLHKKEIDFIILAGYVKMIPEGVIKKYHQKIINIHPSLLPKFGGKGYYGMKVHEAVIQSGIKETGASVHFVDEHYDHGPVVANKRIEVLESDTAESLAARVLKVEHDLYPEVVKALCENRIYWKDNLPKIEVAIEN